MNFQVSLFSAVESEIFIQVGITMLPYLLFSWIKQSQNSLQFDADTGLITSISRVDTATLVTTQQAFVKHFTLLSFIGQL